MVKIKVELKRGYIDSKVRRQLLQEIFSGEKNETLYEIPAQLLISTEEDGYCGATVQLTLRLTPDQALEAENGVFGRINGQLFFVIEKETISSTVSGLLISNSSGYGKCYFPNIKLGIRRTREKTEERFDCNVTGLTFNGGYSFCGDPVAIFTTNDKSGGTGKLGICFLVSSDPKKCAFYLDTTTDQGDGTPYIYFCGEDSKSLTLQ
jgi:hypothetical protein